MKSALKSIFAFIMWGGAALFFIVAAMTASDGDWGAAIFSALVGAAGVWFGRELMSDKNSDEKIEEKKTVMVDEESNNKSNNYPEDGITDDLDGLNSTVWDRGYYCEVDEGIWYEVFVTDEIKGYTPAIDITDEDWEHLGSFHGLILDHYDDDGQITIFVPNGEDEFTLDELTENFI
jgi:hypothetical protein